MTSILDDAENTLLEMNKNIEEGKDIIAEAENYLNNKEQLDKELILKQEEISQLDVSIKEKQEELESYKIEILKAEQEPTIIPAGQHTVGDLVKAGRYLVTGKSNFVVYTKSGGLKVNTILGGGMLGVDEYACNLEEGDEIQTQSRTTLTPILN
jgi:predicted RNase H-like nuclease (RuvC/YqgF family)